MTPLDRWLEAATRDLAPESAERVRAEIEQHRDPAREDGDVDVAALGDPKLANRAYRRVLLTTQEALMVPVYLQRRSRRELVVQVSMALIAMIAFLPGRWLPNSTVQWLFWALLWVDLPVRIFFPANTADRSRRYLLWNAARLVLLTAVMTWNGGWLGATVGPVLAFGAYLDYQRWTIFRKLAGGPAPALHFAANPPLTPIEAIFLNTLRHGDPSQPYAAPVVFAILAGMTYWLPATFGALTVVMTANFFLPRMLPVYTPVRSRYYRLVKWICLAVAAILPLVIGARAPWTGAAFLGFFFWMFETKRISLRRKLPIEEWPRELYL